MRPADRDAAAVTELRSLVELLAHRAAMQPRRQSARDSAGSIIADCTPRLALAPGALIDGERGDLVGRFVAAGLEWIAVDAPSAAATASAIDLPMPRRDDVALLQYTSG